MTMQAEPKQRKPRRKKKYLLLRANFGFKVQYTITERTWYDFTGIAFNRSRRNWKIVVQHDDIKVLQAMQKLANEAERAKDE